MTLENGMYGGSYTQCSHCGLRSPPVHLEEGRCKTAEKCAEWKASLQLATMADIRQAAQQLCDSVTPTPDELLAELHANRKAPT